MVKQRRKRGGEDCEDSQGFVTCGDLDVSKKKINGTLEDDDFDNNGILSDQCRSTFIKQEKSFTIGELVKKQRNNNGSESKQASVASLAVQLAQSLMSNDTRKLDSVLCEAKLEIIQTTLLEMQLSHIIPLLKALYERISTRSATNVKPWLLWIQCILSLHASYLSSVKNLETQLGGLLEWMRVRIGHQQKLLELYGKLSMLGEQIERRINRTVIVAPQPLMVFNDDVSDLEDVESGGSDESCVSSDDEQQEWWDENGFGVNNDCRDDEDSDESGSDSDSNVLMSKVNNDGDNCVVNDDNELEKELSADGDDEENEDEMDIG